MLEADQGTLFLEEIGELPLKAQVKLLRALQLGEIETLGATHPVKVDVRLIAATNQNLIDLVREGRLREDLYYRLNVFPIWVPPLRDRLDDVAELVRLFIARFAAEEGKRVDGIEPNALAMLRRYSWPGNIRQLENAVFRAVALAEGLMLGGERVPADRRPCRGLSRDGARGACAEDLAPRIAGPVMLGRLRHGLPPRSTFRQMAATRSASPR